MLVQSERVVALPHTVVGSKGWTTSCFELIHPFEGGPRLEQSPI